jgi:hypothetical protein
VILNTCSSVISFVRGLEDAAAKFYEDLSRRYPEDEETFLSFTRDNRKYIREIERAYYGVISDAIEGGFAFQLDTDEYRFETEANVNANYAESWLREETTVSSD